MSMANPVVHFEIIGKDPKTLEAFYRQAFDWNMEPSSGAGVDSYTLVHAQAGGHGIDGGPRRRPRSR
jgi:predicted enzyme related to lactoylglutathione lyase